MTFSERPPSEQWAALKFRGETIAQVWFKPEGEPLALIFRIPQDSFHTPGVGQRLTTENLLKAVAIAPEEVESWRHGGVSHSALGGSDPEWTSPLPQPPHGVTHLEVHVRLKPPPQAVARADGGEPGFSSAQWQELEAQWKAILGLEAAVDTMRKNMEGVRAELEASVRRMLTAEEKLNALAADVAQWNKAKSRVHYALPRVNDFIHRATWAAGAPERKRLAELFKDPVEAQASLPPAEKVLQELEALRKERQVLSAQGVAVYQDCKSVTAEIQGALGRLQSNAAVRASKKKGGTGAKGKSL